MYLNFVTLYVCSMSSNLPTFQLLSNGEPTLAHTPEANIDRNTKNNHPLPCKPPETVHKEAVQTLLRLHWDVENRDMVLGQYQLQFGAFRGKTFKWMLENGLGYSAYSVGSAKKETRTMAPLSANMLAFKVNIPEKCSYILF